MTIQRQQHDQTSYNANTSNGTVRQPHPFTPLATNATPVQNFVGPSNHSYATTHNQQQTAVPDNQMLPASTQPQIQQRPSAVYWKSRAQQAEICNNTLNAQSAELQKLQKRLEQTRKDLQNANWARQQLEFKNKELERQVANPQKGRENATAIAHQMVDLEIGS